MKELENSMNTTSRIATTAVAFSLVGCLAPEPFSKNNDEGDGVDDSAINVARSGLTGSSAADGFTFIDSQSASGPDFFWIDIAETGTRLSLGDDAGSSVSIPFSFPFYGTSYSSIGVGSNGGLYFDGSYLHHTNRAIPGTASLNVTRHIAVYWDNLDPGGAGDVYWEVRGTSPDRRLIVQWDEVGHESKSGDTVTVQAVLFESSGNILMQYLDPSLEGGISATVGVQGSSSQGVEYSHDDAILSGGLAICFTPAGGSSDDCDLAGPDSHGYTFTDSVQPGSPQFYWQEISDSGTALGVGNSDEETIDIGFDFEFYGTTYSSVTVAANGGLTFSGIDLKWANKQIPFNYTNGNSEKFVALYFDDINSSIAGEVYHDLQGSAGSRRLVVQFNKVAHHNGGVGDAITAQVILFEGSNNILLQYLNPSSERGDGATVGIQGSATVGLQYSYNDPALSKRLAVCFIAPGSEASDCSFASWLSRKGIGSATEAAEYYAETEVPATFDAWKSAYGFASGDITATYYNNFDLGLGRDMHCRKDGDDVACYVTNYGIAPGGPASTALNHALSGTNPVATVAMVYDDSANGGANDVSFVVYDADGDRLEQVALDSEGPKSVPQVCLPCHGGSYSSSSNSVTGSSFLPFDVFTYEFSTADASYTLSAQQEAFRQLNDMVLDTNPNQAIIDLVNGMYANTGGVDTVGATAEDTYVPSGWSGDEGFYNSVIKHSCRGCHVAQGLDLTSSSAIASYWESTLCDTKQMPHAEKPNKNFWTPGNTLIPAYLSASQGWTSCLDSENDGPIPASFSLVEADSAADLVNTVFHTTGSAPGLGLGTFESANNQIAYEYQSQLDYYRTLLELGSYSGTINTTVIGESTARLDDWNWYTSSYGLYPTEVWTSSGWVTFTSSVTPAAISGKYYYRVQLADASPPSDLGAYINSGSTAGSIKFYTY